MNEQEVKDRIRHIRAKWSNGYSDFAADVHFLLDVIDAATPPPGHIIDDAGNVRKVVGTLPLTADGAVAIPFISAVYHPNHPDRSLDVDVCNDEVIGQVAVPSKDGEFTEWHEYSIADCYSTREAAEAARKEGKP